MKRLLSLLMALAMTASLAACGGSGDTDDTETGAGAETQEPAGSESVVPPVEDLTDVDTSTIPGLEDGVFTVGMECAYAPYNWTQMDDSNGAVPISNVPGAYANGYDVMIAQRICDAYGWDLEIVSSAWDSLTPAVQSGTMDANIAGQSMTADRMAEVDMRAPTTTPPSSASPPRTASTLTPPPSPTWPAAPAPPSPAPSGTSPACPRSRTPICWLLPTVPPQ